MTSISTKPLSDRDPHTARHDERMPTAAGARASLAVATILTVPVATLSAIPTMRFESWSWVCLALSTLIVALTWPTHRDAFRALRQRDLSLDVLASIGVLAAYLWALYAVAVGHPSTSLIVPAVLSIALTVRQRVIAAAGPLAAVRRVPAWIVPGVLAVAGVTLAVWLGFNGASWSTVSAAVAVLVVACPGALGLAAPAAVVAGTRRGADLGVTYRDPSALDAARDVDTLILRGLETVADGMHVASVDPLSPDHDRNLRWFAGALEHSCEDPVGRAISRLSVRGRVTGVQQHPDLGVSGSVDRHPVRVGSPTWIGIEAPDHVGVTVAVEVDGRPLGTITVIDTPRPTAKKAVDALRTLGLEPILVTTRDQAAADHLAEEIGITHIVAETGATGGRQLVDDLRADGRRVALLATSPEDAASLDSAELSIAAPDGGAAVSVADGDVAGAVASLRLARAIDVNAKTGTSLALAYNAVAIPVAAAGLLHAVPAAVAMAVASVVVLLGSLRLRGDAR